MKKMLFVVDYQNDFVSGTLGTPEAQLLFPFMEAKIKEYRDAGHPVVFTRDTHYEETYLSSQEGRNLPILHCLKDTWGWQVTDGIDTDGSLIIDKEAFGVANIGEYVAEDIEQVEIVGICTDICVVSNALILKSQRPELPIITDSKCCAGLTPEKHIAALEVLRSNQIKVL